MKTIFIFILLSSFTLSDINAQNFTKDALIQDIRQLSNILETSHPDPYITSDAIFTKLQL